MLRQRTFGRLELLADGAHALVEPHGGTVGGLIAGLELFDEVGFRDGVGKLGGDLRIGTVERDLQEVGRGDPVDRDGALHAGDRGQGGWRQAVEVAERGFRLLDRRLHLLVCPEETADGAGHIAEDTDARLALPKAWVLIETQAFHHAARDCERLDQRHLSGDRAGVQAEVADDRLRPPKHLFLARVDQDLRRRRVNRLDLQYPDDRNAGDDGRGRQYDAPAAKKDGPRPTRRQRLAALIEDGRPAVDLIGAREFPAAVHFETLP